MVSIVMDALNIRRFRGITYETVKDGCLGITSTPSRLKVYKIDFPMVKNGPYHLHLHLHNLFNCMLNCDVIEIIVSYLSDQDLLNLAISKLFLPALLSMPKFFNAINKYYMHTLCLFFHTKHNFYLKCVYIPTIFNNEFYVSEDIQILENCKYQFTQRIYNFTIYLELVTLQFTMVFNSFNNYQAHSYYYKIPSCKNNCMCNNFMRHLDFIQAPY
jgi:hypothetical protein